MILDRFASLVFIGDDLVRTVYAGLNMLLREDLGYGALKSWEITEGPHMAECVCKGQLLDDPCGRYAIKNSSEAKEPDESGGHGGGYYCERKDRSQYYSLDLD